MAQRIIDSPSSWRSAKEASQEGDTIVVVTSGKNNDLVYTMLAGRRLVGPTQQNSDAKFTDRAYIRRSNRGW